MKVTNQADGPIDLVTMKSGVGHGTGKERRRDNGFLVPEMLGDVPHKEVYLHIDLGSRARQEDCGAQVVGMREHLGC